VCVYIYIYIPIGNEIEHRSSDIYEYTVRTNKDQLPYITLKIKPTLQPEKENLPKVGQIDDLPCRQKRPKSSHP
jgi:hypothetical protein